MGQPERFVRHGGTGAIIHGNAREGVEVSDDGPGVPDSEKGKIFDMFYTGSNGISDGRRSLGFGLALCKTIVQAHGGTITLTDNQPHGSVFTFSLPAEEVPGNG